MPVPGKTYTNPCGATREVTHVTKLSGLITWKWPETDDETTITPEQWRTWLQGASDVGHTTLMLKEQRRFGVLLILLAAICGLVFGAGATRIGACHTRDTVLALDAARVVQLEVEAADLKATLNGCNSALFAEVNAKPPAACVPDPLGGVCAVSWSRLWRVGHGQIFVGCGPATWWIVTWREFNPKEQP